MAYKGKIYVAFDAQNDNSAYKALKNFRQEDGNVFDFYDGARFLKDLDKVSDDSLKALIQENMEEADVVLVLLSKTVKSMRRFVKWQIEHAINRNKPLIVMNTNDIRGIDLDLTPTALKTNLCLVIPNNEKALELACLNWPKSHKEHLKNNDKLPYRYDYEVYRELFNEEKEGE